MIEQLNLFDGLFIGFTLLMVISACKRGLAIETLHTLVFVGAMVGAMLFFQQGNASFTAATIAFTAINLGYLTLAIYLLSTVVLRLLQPFLMKPMSEFGLRSRLSAGSLAMVKILAAALFVHIWYAAHTPTPHPERLEALPSVLQNSELVQMADGGWTQTIGEFLAARGLMTIPPASEEAVEETLEAPVEPMPEQTVPQGPEIEEPFTETGEEF